MSFHNHDNDLYNQQHRPSERKKPDESKKVDDFEIQVKVLTAIKKGLEKSLTEAFVEIERLKQEVIDLKTSTT